MSHKIAISLVGAAIGAGLLSMSSASAAPINGAVIGKVASTDELTQKVVWRGRGVGWRGYGWRRGVGVGLVGAGVATAAAYGAYSAYNNGYDNNGYDYASDTSGYGDNRWRPGWRVASAAQNYNYGSPNYNYGYANNYNAGSYGYRNNYGSGYY